MTQSEIRKHMDNIQDMAQVTAAIIEIRADVDEIRDRLASIEQLIADSRGDGK